MQTSAELSEHPIRSGRRRRRPIIEFRFPIPAVRRLQLPARSGHPRLSHKADIGVQLIIQPGERRLQPKCHLCRLEHVRVIGCKMNIIGIHAMPDCDWVCHSCHASNPKGSEACGACGCPALASVADIINPANRQGICDMITTWKKKMPASSAQSNKRRSAR